MSPRFVVNPHADGGDFALERPALAWDILRVAGSHAPIATVDMSACVHLKPYALACLCATAELARQDGRSVRLVPPNDSRCREHLERLGFPFFFDGEWSSSARRETNITIERVGWPPKSQGERIVEVLAPRAELEPGLSAQMIDSLDEIIRNALTHARSSIDCIVAGQAFPRAGYVDITVLDLGQTVRGHLVQNPEHRHISDDESAILKALEDGVTGTPAGERNSRNEENSGAGLAWVKEFCESGGGQMTVLSGDRWVTCGVNREPIIGTLFQRFQGCLVNLRFFTDRVLPADGTKAIL